MNPTSTTFFNKHLENLQNEYSEISLEIETYAHDNNIKSPLMGDKHYYELKIAQQEIMLDIKRTEAILNGKEFSYIRYHRPIITRRISELKNFMWDAPEVIT